MTTHTIKGYIVHQVWRDSPNGKAEIQFSHFKPSAENDSSCWIRTVIKEHEFTIEMPDDFDPRPAMVEALRTEKEKARADFARRIKTLDDQINSLLALEMA